jgi:hypothetical protein
MNKLYETLTDDCFDEKTKLRINYNLLQGASRYAAFKHCLKKYLFGHIRSKIIEVQAKDWEIALMLPVDFFASEKGPTPTRSKVYKDSEKMY